jgi:nucleotide-binding universal stress UspA family protein
MEFSKQRQAQERRGVHRVSMKRAMIQNILVPVDFSEMSIQAINTATRLARRFGASTHLTHVRQFAYASGFLPAPPMDPFPVMPDEQDAEKNAAKDLHVLARECDVPLATCHILSGGPAFDEICRFAQKIPADLIVLPTHGYTGLKHVFLGSTAERVVQHSPCPVFVARPRKGKSEAGRTPTLHTILVPVDFSGCSRGGLRYAIDFANEFGARIILLHATYLGYIYSSEGTALYDIPALQKAARKTAERQMRQLVRSVNFGGVKFETAFTDGSPVLDICTFAKDHNVDLIITSTHGLTGLEHVLIGSIAEQVVRHAPCSVLVVPSHPKTRLANLTKRGAREARMLASSPRRIRRVTDEQQARKSPRGKAFTKRDRKLASHSFPERRKINKFRESHFSP